VHTRAIINTFSECLAGFCVFDYIKRVKVGSVALLDAVVIVAFSRSRKVAWKFNILRHNDGVTLDGEKQRVGRCGICFLNINGFNLFLN
jgi:hypothetical protein